MEAEARAREGRKAKGRAGGRTREEGAAKDQDKQASPKTHKSPGTEASPEARQETIMANIKLPDGQNLDMPDEIAKDDEMLRNALAPYVPDIRNAKLNRSTSAGVMTVNVVKQAGTKGAAEPSQANFEGWAIVEMMGHQREIGFVTTQAFG